MGQQASPGKAAKASKSATERSGAERKLEAVSAGGRSSGSVIDAALIADCRRRLLEAKADILNRVRDSRKDLHIEDKGGDEADQTARVLAEGEMLSHQERMRTQLLEIEQALARIESGVYGICEETEEQIEADRLRAIPWTRLSIEGAEIRESVKKRYARS
jgi:DnaK suppressor protein